MDHRRGDGREYILPSLARRCAADLLDACLAFFIKAVLIQSMMHLIGTEFSSFPLLHLIEGKGVSRFARHYVIKEPVGALDSTVALALFYQLFDLLYEITCVGGAGGATPGKFLLGLQVVTCDTAVLVAPRRVLVRPSSKVSMATSAKRALFKRVCYDSFFSTFVTVLFLHENQAAYDIVAGTIVVTRE